MRRLRWLVNGADGAQAAADQVAWLPSSVNLSLRTAIMTRWQVERFASVSRRAKEVHNVTALLAAAPALRVMLEPRRVRVHETNTCLGWFITHSQAIALVDVSHRLNRHRSPKSHAVLTLR